MIEGTLHGLGSELDLYLTAKIACQSYSTILTMPTDVNSSNLYIALISMCRWFTLLPMKEPGWKFQKVHSAASSKVLLSITKFNTLFRALSVLHN